MSKKKKNNLAVGGEYGVDKEIIHNLIPLLDLK